MAGGSEDSPYRDDEWRPGEQAHYEYHCYRGHDSADAPLWYRSHQPVTILGREPTDLDDGPMLEANGQPVPGPYSAEQRMEAGLQYAYRTRFPDGHEGTAMEDELYTDPRHWDPAGGPPPIEEIAQYDPAYAQWRQGRPASVTMSGAGGDIVTAGGAGDGSHIGVPRLAGPGPEEAVPGYIVRGTGEIVDAPDGLGYFVTYTERIDGTTLRKHFNDYGAAMAFLAAVNAPETGPPSGSHLAGTALWWKPGAYGRGMVMADGSVRTWPEDEGTHDQVAYQLNQDPVHKFLIRPSGEYFDHDFRYEGTPEIHAAVQAADPRLQPIEPPGFNARDWALGPWDGRGRVAGTLPCPKCGEPLHMEATGYYDPIRCPSCGFKSPLGGETRIIGQPVTPEERTQAWEGLAKGYQPEPYVNPSKWRFGPVHQGASDDELARWWEDKRNQWGLSLAPWHIRPQVGEGVDPTDTDARDLDPAGTGNPVFYQGYPHKPEYRGFGFGGHEDSPFAPFPGRYDEGYATPHRLKPNPEATGWDFGPPRQGAAQLVGAMTPNQQAHFREGLAAKYGPEHTKVIHQFPDGWALHHLPTWNEVGREGEMMHHCWGGLGGSNDPYPDPETDDSSIAVSLRDPNGWPHMSFHLDASDNTPYEFAEHGGGSPPYESPHWDYLKQWANVTGGNFTHPMEEDQSLHWGNRTARTAAYWHVAPTAERARIRQHGLQPSNPANSGMWTTFGDDDRAPRGVYISPNRKWMDGYRTRLEFMRGVPHDVWEVEDPGGYTYPDPDLGLNSRYVMNPVLNPKLVEGPEHREQMPEYMMQGYVRPTDPWQRGRLPYGQGEGSGGPYPANDPQAWSDRVGSWTHPATGEALPEWTPGVWGKGMIIGSQPVTWQTDAPPRNGGGPHHDQIVDQAGLPGSTTPSGPLRDYSPELGWSDRVIISPEGWYTHAHQWSGPAKDAIDPTIFARTIPGMKFVQDADKWTRRALGAVVGAAAPGLPPVPGTAPIPEGHVRLYHYTGADPEQIRQQGLLMSQAKGESYGEPNQIWASARPPSFDNHNVVEFHVPRDDPRWDIGKFDPAINYSYYEGGDSRTDPDFDYAKFLHDRNYNVTFNGDIRPEEIAAVHEPWHQHYRYLMENYPTPESAAPDQFDWALDPAKGGGPDPGRAVQEWKGTLWPDARTGAAESLLPIPMHRGCPQCGGPHTDEETGECTDCGYAIPYDGWEIMQGHDEHGPVPGHGATGWGTALEPGDLDRSQLGEPRWGAWGEPEKGVSWHLTDNPQFELDPTHVPEDNALAIQQRTQPGLYLGDPEHWFNGYNYVRPYVAEIEHPPIEQGRWGGESFLPAEAFPQSRVRRVIPTDEWVREQYGEPGWFEEHENPQAWNQPRKHFPDYRYEGPDVREMAPEEHARQQGRADRYIREVRPQILTRYDENGDPVEYGDPRWERLGMAADPDWWSQYTAQHPYAYHGTNEDDTSTFARGILPWDHPENPVGSPQFHDTISEPRPGHVYLYTEPPHPADYMNSYRVDLRKIDPSRVSPDEDWYSDGGQGFRRDDWERAGIEPWEVREQRDRNFGETAERLNFGQLPDQTHRAIGEYGRMAIRGPISPEAIEHHQTTDKMDQWGEGYDQYGNPLQWNGQEWQKAARYITVEEARQWGREGVPERSSAPWSRLAVPDEASSAQNGWTPLVALVRDAKGLPPDADNRDMAKSAWSLNPFHFDPQLPTPEQAAQGRSCFFHPDRPAVIATGFAAMCPECYDSYQRASQAPVQERPMVDPSPWHSAATDANPFEAKLYHGSDRGLLGPVRTPFWMTSHEDEAKGFAGPDAQPGVVHPVTVRFNNPAYHFGELPVDWQEQARLNHNDGAVVYLPGNDAREWDPDPYPKRHWAIALDPGTVVPGHQSEQY